MAAISSRLELARHSTAIQTDWDGVSEGHPCPICGGRSDCSRCADEAFVACARRPSDWPLTNGAWLHRLTLDEEARQLEGEPVGVRT
jgi:hypothetical protein